MSLIKYEPWTVVFFRVLSRYEQAKGHSIYRRLPTELQQVVDRFLHEMRLSEVLCQLHTRYLVAFWLSSCWIYAEGDPPTLAHVMTSGWSCRPVHDFRFRVLLGGLS